LDLPGWQALHAWLADDGFTVIAIALDENVAAVSSARRGDD
jgi:hypothetical protein